MSSFRTLSVLALSASTASSFLAPATRFTPAVALSSQSQSILEKNTFENDETLFLEALPLAADYGFDPLGLSKVDLFFAGAEDKERAPELVLRDYRDAELRHGRLAMLAALAWPVQELLSPTLARMANRELGVSGLSDILTETAGRVPSVLNGGLEQGALAGFLIGVAAGIGAIDSVSLRLKDEMGSAFVPGDFGFDPLRLMKGASDEAAKDMQAKEINNGRLAMVAVTIFVLEEAITGTPITELTPFLFHPIWDTADFWQFSDAAFGVASAAQRIPVDEAIQMLPQ